MGLLNLIFSAFLFWVYFICHTHQLQSSQTQVLLQLRKHLEYPLALENWENYSGDFCSMLSTPHMTITCQDNSVSELKILGDKHGKVSDFIGFAVPNETLSDAFSIDSLVTTLSRLSGLRVLSLVSLGIWGPLPDKIHRLASLEVLDLSSNYIFGSIPPKISTLVKLRALSFDANFFNDSVPDWMDSLSNLTALSLKNNRFKGQFPSSISRIGTLTDIALSHNELSGKLPDLGTLTNLHVLDLRDNHLDSELPIMPKGLVTALLSENSFSGEFPAQFGELDQLQHLDLSYNSLTGVPPPALFSLENISYLNLASNMLSGSLPDSLGCGAELGFVDISANRLMGVLPSCLSITSDKRVVKFGGNCFSIGAQHQHQESYCKAAAIKGKHSRGKEIGVLIGAIAGAVIVVPFLAFLFFIVFRRCRKYTPPRPFEQPVMPKVPQENPSTALSPELLANARYISQAAKLGNQGSPAYRVFTLEELKEATNNFDSMTFLGEGSVGKLYKGKLENGAYVTIRTIALYRRYSIRNLRLRLDLLSKLRHPHLVSLLGHCIDGGGLDDFSVDRFFLVYEYMPNGNYHAHLSEDCPDKVLKWPDRLAVLIGVAKAVHFLHTGVIPGSLNNRLKTNNILLDEHRIAKLSDYGMSIVTEENDKVEAKKEGGKPWQMKKVEDDVYNFGFILLESLVGPVVTGKGETFLLNEMASFGSQDGRRRIVDPVVLITSSQESLSIAVSITSKCLSPEPSSRPSFEDVLWNLQYAAQVQATADADQKSDGAPQT